MLSPMSTRAAIVFAAAAGYALGSIPVANTIARLKGIDDLRSIGDHNPGFWNAKEQVGPRSALPIFVGDVAKGAVAAGIGATLAGRGQWWLTYVGGGAAMIGHAFPATAGFRGGRSVLTFVGAGLVCTPRPAAVSVAVAAATWPATRRFDLAARLGIATFPIVQIFVDGPARTAATGALMTFVGARFASAHSAVGTGDLATSATA